MPYRIKSFADITEEAGFGVALAFEQGGLCLLGGAQQELLAASPFGEPALHDGEDAVGFCPGIKGGFDHALDVFREVRCEGHGAEVDGGG